MFRKKTPTEIVIFMFDLANKYLQENTNSSVIAAFKIMSSLEKIQHEKAIQGKRGQITVKLKDMGLMNAVIRDEVNQEDVKSISCVDIKSMSNIERFMFKLSEDYLKEGTPTSVTAAYKILATLNDAQLEKDTQNLLARVVVKLKDMKLFEGVHRDESNSKEADEKPPSSPIRSRL